MAKQTSELLHESIEEHLAIKRVLADPIEMKLDQDSFKAKISVLKENVSHHALKEEEKELFPRHRGTTSPQKRRGRRRFPRRHARAEGDLLKQSRV